MVRGKLTPDELDDGELDEGYDLTAEQEEEMAVAFETIRDMMGPGLLVPKKDILDALYDSYFDVDSTFEYVQSQQKKLLAAQAKRDKGELDLGLDRLSLGGVVKTGAGHSEAQTGADESKTPALDAERRRSPSPAPATDGQKKVSKLRAKAKSKAAPKTPPEPEASVSHTESAPADGMDIVEDDFHSLNGIPSFVASALDGIADIEYDALAFAAQVACAIDCRQCEMIQRATLGPSPDDVVIQSREGTSLAG